MLMFMLLAGKDMMKFIYLRKPENAGEISQELYCA